MPSDPHQITKPTIAELEAMLAKGPEGLRVQINPDGSVRVIELSMTSTFSMRMQKLMAEIPTTVAVGTMFVASVLRAANQ